MAWNGKWKKVQCDNGAAIIKELAKGDAQKTKALEAYLLTGDVIEDITVTSDGTRRITFINGEQKMDLDSQFGKVLERDTFLGKSKISSKSVSDTRIEVRDEGTDHPSSDYVFSMDGGKLHVKQTTNGVTCTRVYERCT